MKFPYRKEGSQPSPAHPGRFNVYRPRVRIRLKYQTRVVDLFALVDSGADDCLFPLEVATYLNLPLSSSRTNRYHGIGPGAITAAFETVTLEVGGWSFPLYAGFTDAPTATLASLAGTASANLPNYEKWLEYFFGKN